MNGKVIFNGDFRKVTKDASDFKTEADIQAFGHELSAQHNGAYVYITREDESTKETPKSDSE